MEAAYETLLYLSVLAVGEIRQTSNGHEDVGVAGDGAGRRLSRLVVARPGGLLPEPGVRVVQTPFGALARTPPVVGILFGANGEGRTPMGKHGVNGGAEGT
jgi:hypothetical protein